MCKHCFRLCPDSYEATGTRGGFRHYKCIVPGCQEEYSYETAPTVYHTNPKTGQPVTLAKAMNPYLPNFEMVPDNELHTFWSKKDQEWRVYVTGSHDSLTNGKWCGNEVVCWSAPVYDLSDWRYEGVTQDYGWYFACDMAYDLQTDQAVWYSFPFFGNPQMNGTHMWVNGTSDPGSYFDQPFCPEGIHEIDDNGMHFDPAILIEDDGTVTIVWSPIDFAPGAVKRCQMSRLNADRTEILWSVPVTMAEGEPNSQGFTPDNYEANTLNYIPEFGVYVLQYSYVADPGPKNGQGYYPLAYVYTFEKDLEHARWHWGGIIADNSGRYKRNPVTGKVENTGENSYSWDNNHGGLVQINGDWYLSNHRHIGVHSCRQGYLQKVEMYVEDGRFVIEPTEYNTSIGDSIDAYQPIPAYTACHITPCQSYSTQEESAGEKKPDGSDTVFLPPRSYIASFKGAGEPNNGFVYDDPAYAAHRTPIVRIQDATEVGFKYLDFGTAPQQPQQIRLLVSKETSDIDGKVCVYLDAPSEAKGGICIGQIELSAAALTEAGISCTDTGKVSWSALDGSLTRAVGGVHAIYFIFAADSEGVICKMDEFTISREG